MKKTFFEVKLPVSVFKEGKRFIAYTPALDLSTSGKDYDEVKKHFEEIVNIFFEEVFQKGTLKEVLEDLGWRKIQKQWSPPLVITHESEKIRIPAFV